MRFESDPLGYLDEVLAAAPETLWLPRRQLLVTRAETSREVLANRDGLFAEHSDFFHTRRGPFGPREAQVAIGRGARRVLRARLAGRRGDLAAGIPHHLGPTSEWPDAGNWWIHHLLREVLAAGADDEPLRRTLDAVVARAVLAGARQRQSRWRRWWFRRRVLGELSRALTARRQRGADPPADLLDVMVAATDPEVPAVELAELYLGFVFALGGSVGFTLGWSLYLLGTQPPDQDVEPGWVVREALRLWPVAWLFARRPRCTHEIAGVTVTPADEVLVSPYVVQRNALYWDQPTRFQPARWRGAPDSPAYLPFGWGPHMCPAATWTFELAEAALSPLLQQFRWQVTPRGERPFVSAALAPPRFTLALAELDSSFPEERR